MGGSEGSARIDQKDIQANNESDEKEHTAVYYCHLKLSDSVRLSCHLRSAAHTHTLGSEKPVAPPQDPGRTIKVPRRRCRWNGWASTGWWSPRSARSPRTGPCWTPASGPRSSLQRAKKTHTVQPLLHQAQNPHRNLPEPSQRKFRLPHCISHLCLPSRCRGRPAPTRRGWRHPDRKREMRCRCVCDLADERNVQLV